MLEDTGNRFLARVENSRSALGSTAAFAVRKRPIENCEPQRIVVANFDVRDQGRMPVPNPDFMPRDSSVTLDLGGQT
ncbi:hypothetical protein [Nitrososphaera sp.]|uniref:hypothetical protein n=1 Tax=Nitrososphaera sp. TaxID=1971748 RepID=UPI002EDB0772